MRPLINSKKVRELLGGISQATLDRMIKAEEIPFVLLRQGTTRRRKKTVAFDEDVIERWIISKSRGPGRPRRTKQMVTDVATQTDSDAKSLNSNGAHRFEKPEAIV
jgi:hypothetical protein